MLADIEREVEYTRSMIGRDALSKRVMKAMHDVPREKFVPEDLIHLAFDNGPLPIGYSQTISQPYIVALMTDLLEPEKNDVVLEVGTGSGYQAAVLSKLIKKVYSVEIIDELAKESAARLAALHYTNVETRTGNGYLGWPEHAPYDGIIVTACASHIPEALIEQLKPGGRLVIPVGSPSLHQELMLVKKDETGKTQTESILGVAFVPMVEKKSAEC
jgi:protein-L-isoaspartate(D-aspartate) O-methyltransferase